MVGFDTSDDAAVYKINDQLAMIQTVDFFPPIVDDPYTFGQIAAANAISDIYAMGGVPKLAMNLICFPTCLDLEIMEQILQGGYSKVQEAGAIIAGGHTIEDNEPKYGLCVTGYVHPKDILANSTAREGDILVLTKSLGTGILSGAAMAEILPADDYALMTKMMSRLNRYAQEAMMPSCPSSCTDITGFGLLGHAAEMAKGSGKTIELFSQNVPALPQALKLAREGMIPAGAYNNMAYLEKDVEISKGVPLELSDVMYDPQTSGGLLIAVSEEETQNLCRRLKDNGEEAHIIGYVKAFDGKAIRVL